MLSNISTLSKQLQQHMSEIKTQYHTAKSYLSYVSRWYAELSWWNKIKLGSALIMASTFIGLAMQAGLLFFIGSCLFYPCLGFLLLEHDAQGRTDTAAFSKQMAALETSLNQIVQLQTDLQQIVNAMHEKNNQLTQENELFGAQIETVTKNNITYDSVVAELQKTQLELQQRTQALATLQTQATDAQEKTQNAIDEQTQLLSEEGLNLRKTNLALVNEEQRLAQMCLVFENSTARLTMLEQQLQKEVQTQVQTTQVANTLATAAKTVTTFEQLNARASNDEQDDEASDAEIQQLLSRCARYQASNKPTNPQRQTPPAFDLQRHAPPAETTIAATCLNHSQ